MYGGRIRLFCFCHSLCASLWVINYSPFGYTCRCVCVCVHMCMCAWSVQVYLADRMNFWRLVKLLLLLPNLLSCCCACWCIQKEYFCQKVHTWEIWVHNSLSLFREKNERENEKRITPGATITYCAIWQLQKTTSYWSPPNTKWISMCVWLPGEEEGAGLDGVETLKSVRIRRNPNVSINTDWTIWKPVAYFSHLCTHSIHKPCESFCGPSSVYGRRWLWCACITDTPREFRFSFISLPAPILSQDLHQQALSLLHFFPFWPQIIGQQIAPNSSKISLESRESSLLMMKERKYSHSEDWTFFYWSTENKAIVRDV
jgi:hypothetical protein